MLYKKYHRDLVKRFKNGFKFSPTSESGWDLYIGKNCVVICKPFILAVTRNRRRGDCIIVTKVAVSVGDDKRERKMTLTLVDPRGKLINYVGKD